MPIPSVSWWPRCPAQGVNVLPQSQGRLVVIVGATATGKSRLAMRLATEYPGEIISADSRLVYRHMDIGTAKPSREDRRAVPHHLIDIIDPDTNFGLQQFIRLVKQAYLNVNSTGNLPYLVGGTGQYIWAVLEGWQIPEVPPDSNTRRRLEALAKESGVTAVYDMLVSIDQPAALRVDRHNLRRVIRAIEVAEHRRQYPGPRMIDPGFNSLVIGLKMDRQRLYKRIDERVDEMMASGWLDEVRDLLGRGYDSSLPSMSGVGYGDLSAHIRGELSLDEAVARTKFRTHRYARQQHAWFRTNDPRIRWIDAEEKIDLADTILQEWFDSSD